MGRKSGFGPFYPIMASRLTPHHPNKGDFEFGGLNLKGCCGKVRWNTTCRQGDICIDDLFCKDEVLTRNLNPRAVSCQGAAESSANEHLEVDWIAKEIAFQELICNDRSSHWSDAYLGNNELVKEEQEVDIISTLTAVAALFRDWCTDLSEPLVNDSLEGSSSLKGDNKDKWVWISDPNIEVNKEINNLTNLPLQNGILRWSTYDLTWNEFDKEPQKSQHMPHPAFVPHDFTAKGSMYSTESCERRRVEEESQSFEPPNQHNGATSHYLVACRDDCRKRTSLLGVHGRLENGIDSFDEMGMPDQYVTFGRSPAASRYSFCQEGDTTEVGQTHLREESVNDEVFATWLYSGEQAFNATWLTPEARNVLPPTIAEDVVVGFEEDLLLDGVLDVVESRKMVEGAAIGATTMHQAPCLHEALTLALSYMNLQGLLTMERVCRFLRDWIRSDVLLWQQLHVEPPLSKGLTDEVLLELACRSRGQLRCLSLVDCTRVTEAAVEQVVAANPRLTKLFLPGCSRISADSIVRMVEMLTKHGHGGLPGLKQVRVRNIYGLTRQHLASLEKMLGVREPPHPASSRKPQYYHNGHHGSYYDDEDDRPIDVEECPECTNVRLVYDCTRERCQQKPGSECRACFLCTVRCEECGRCISNDDYEETFSLDLLCSCCWLRLPKCTECSRPGGRRHADHFVRVPDTTFVRDGDGRSE